MMTTAIARPGDEAGPILCRCWAWRHGLMGDHRDWLAELKRNRAAGRVPDDFYFAALAGEVRLDRADLSR